MQLIEKIVLTRIKLENKKKSEKSELDNLSSGKLLLKVYLNLHLKNIIELCIETQLLNNWRKTFKNTK